MDPQVPSPSSQEPTTGSQLKPDTSTPHIIPGIYAQVLQAINFLCITTKTLYMSSLPCIPHASTISFFLNLLSKYLARSTNYEALDSTFLQSLVTSSPLGPNIFLSTLFSNALNPCYLHPQCETVLNPCVCTTGGTTGLHIVIYIYVQQTTDRKTEDTAKI